MLSPALCVAVCVASLVRTSVGVPNSKDERTSHTGAHAMEFSDADFRHEVQHGMKKPHVVLFYKDRISPDLKEAYAKLAKYYMKTHVESHILIAEVNCEKTRDSCKSFGSSHTFPLIKFYHEAQDDGVLYSGDFSFQDMKEFIYNAVHNRYEETHGVTSLTAQTMRDHQDHMMFVQFYAPWCSFCKKMAPVWEELAHSLAHTALVIAKADCTVEKQICGKFPVEGFPTLLLIRGNDVVKRFRGNRTLEGFLEFLQPYEGKFKLSPDEKSQKRKIRKKKNKVPVTTLTAENFKSATSHGMWFIKFYSPTAGYCEELKKIWDELGEKYKDNIDISFGKIDCSENADAKTCHDNNVWGLPSLWLFRDGHMYKEYIHERHLDHMHSFVQDHVTTHDEL